MLKSVFGNLINCSVMPLKSAFSFSYVTSLFQQLNFAFIIMVLVAAINVKPLSNMVKLSIFQTLPYFLHVDQNGAWMIFVDVV